MRERTEGKSDRIRDRFLVKCICELMNRETILIWIKEMGETYEESRENGREKVKQQNTELGR